MFRLKLTECGTVNNGIYATTYTQPLHNFIMAEIYRLYIKLSWPFWRFLERFQDLKDPFLFTEENGHLAFPIEKFLPFTNRQDLRYDFLSNKNRIEIETVYEY